MQRTGIILLLVFLFFRPLVFAQPATTREGADAESYRLYSEKKWKELMVYGKNTLNAGIDFPLLRMRVGYAAFVLGNYSESLNQYEKVYSADAENKTALYYCYLNHLYLNEPLAARYYAARLPEETRKEEKIRSSGISGVDLEYSYKSPSPAVRGDAQYAKLGVSANLGYRLNWENAGALYDQTISETLFTAVTNNRSIQISQKEYYTKLSYALTGKLTLVAGLHYLYTPFNNFIYNNYIGFGGLRFSTPWLQLQGLFMAGRIRDSSYQQADVSLRYYPLGNTKLYLISRAALGTESAFTQVAGFRIWKKGWLEGNITAGKYNKITGSDALYVYDDIDTKKFRAGGSLYVLAGKHTTLKIHYTYDRKELYKRPGNNYDQQSITGGLQWTL